MNCPKCNEQTISKIYFKGSKKNAYLCNICSTYWFTGEKMSATTGHILEDARDDQHADDMFEYVDKNDKEYQEDIDEKEREAYELL